VGSLSPSSNDSQATGCPQPATHSLASVQNPEQGAQRFWSKPHTDSGAYRTLIPE
jgi:hypothetical protein